MSKTTFRLFLALHDIGKPFTADQSDTREQYYHTRIIFSKKSRETYGFSQEDMDLILKLVDGDPLGRFFKGMQHNRTAEELIPQTLEELRRMHEGEFSFPFPDFFHLLTIYYQSDISSLYAGCWIFLRRSWASCCNMMKRTLDLYLIRNMGACYFPILQPIHSKPPIKNWKKPFASTF